MGTFLAAGIQEVVLVVGHGSSESRRLVRPWRSILDIAIVENHEFDRKNLDFSLFSARKYLNGSVFYIEGDLILDPRLIAALMRGPSSISIAASKVSRGQRVDTVVQRKQGVCSLKFSEHGSLDLAGSEGEFICAGRFSGRALNELRAQLSECDFVGEMRLYEIFSTLMRTHTTALVDASEYPWIEIDNELDLERATAIVATLDLCPVPSAPSIRQKDSPN